MSILQGSVLSKQPDSRHDRESYPVRVLLIDDQMIIAEAVKRMVEDQPDIDFFYCDDPTKAIEYAAEVHPTVILQDLVMPEMDGLTLVRYFRSNPATRDIPMIVLSVKEDPKIKADAFAVGANDYSVKLPDKQELLARIRYHSAAYIRLLQRNEAYEELEKSQKALKNELNEAAEYVRTLLPAPMHQDIRALWRFIPSTQLGGDAFGYHWIDNDNFALYLLDVCGHGIGAALLSISVMNVLRSQSLSHTNFLEPHRVLEALNDSFPMEKHNNMFFTIWYGIYNKHSHEITYSSGGHPPAILFTGEDRDSAQLYQMTTPGLVIGGMAGSKYTSDTCTIQSYNKLYLFSDGVYEIERADGSTFTLDEFVKILNQARKQDTEDVDYILETARLLNGEGPFADDFSVVQFEFEI